MMTGVWLFEGLTESATGRYRDGKQREFVMMRYLIANQQQRQQTRRSG